MGGCLEVFIQISDIEVPTNDPLADGLWVSESYDATSHFETASEDVLQIYERLTGEKLDLNIQPGDDDDE